MRLLTALLLAVPLWAHVGSPDVFYEAMAGPYRLLVTIRPPQVIPGVAGIEIRSATPNVRRLRVTPLTLTGPAAKLAPVPDDLEPSKDDPQFFTGSLWFMAVGSWQVRVQADGTEGPATLAVPVPAASTRVLGMQRGLGGILMALGAVLFLGLVTIIGAASGEAQLAPGLETNPGLRRRARITMAVTAMILAGVVWLGSRWWHSEAGNYAHRIFKPLTLKAELQPRNRLALTLEDPGWLTRRTDDLLPDHGHLMHLYLIRIPEMDLVWHLHPERGGDSSFTQALPAMPAGRYALYGDIVHANGFPETATAVVDLPQLSGEPLAGDDAGGSGPPITKADYNSVVAPLSGGYKMVWERDSQPLHARRPYEFRFRVEDPSGRPAGNMELYMGMTGHAAFVSADRSVFAHVHPSGSVPMAALDLAAEADPHRGHMMHAELPAQVVFPYGLPRPGN
ncbi:MAG: hypothetical protein JO323_22435, partial [Acidobacteriia bacterium]|nr:hypothetical protein [Terriglobia bacterium]